MEDGEKSSNKSRTWIAALHLPPALLAAYLGWFEVVNVLFVTLNVLLLWSMYRCSDNADIGPQVAMFGCMTVVLVGILAIAGFIISPIVAETDSAVVIFLTLGAYIGIGTWLVHSFSEVTWVGESNRGIRENWKLDKQEIKKLQNHYGAQEKRLKEQAPVTLEDCLAYVDQEGCGPLLQYCPAAMRANREIVSAAIRHPQMELVEQETGESRIVPLESPLEFAADELCEDPLLVLEAISHCAAAYQFGSEELRLDPDVFLQAFEAEMDQRAVPPHDVRLILDVDLSSHKNKVRFYECLNRLVSIYNDWDYPDEQWKDLLLCYTADIERLFSEKKWLIRGLEETYWAEEYIPEQFQDDPEVLETETLRMSDINRYEQEELERLAYLSSVEYRKKYPLTRLRDLLKIIAIQKSGKSIRRAAIVYMINNRLAWNVETKDNGIHEP